MLTNFLVTQNMCNISENFRKSQSKTVIINSDNHGRTSYSHKLVSPSASNCFILI